MNQRNIILLLLLLSGLFSCDARQREEALKNRETALNEREQALLLREKSLALREEEFLKVKSRMDSTIKADTTYKINPLLTGLWEVKMTCTETTCPGSAVGDVKTEKWHVAYQGNKLIAKAMVNDQLVRVYTGFFTGNTIEMVEDLTSAVSPSMARMVVRLRLVDDTKLEGEREIIRQNNCKVVYALQVIKVGT